MTVTELRRRAVALGLGCLLLAPAAAFADAPTAQDRTLAESLFRDAKKLVAAKRYAEACPMLAESQRLDPGGGTLLNLATCHVAAGLTATAWGELSEALATAKRDGRADRVKAAQADIAALEPRLSRLTVVVAVAPSVPTEVDFDGKPLPTVAWGRPFPVDPGPHALKAHAPGRAPFEASVLVLANADQKKIDVPLLAPAVAAVPVVAVAAPPPVALVTPPPGPVTDAPAPPVETDHTARRTAGYVTGAVGVVGLGVGTYLALHAIALRSDSNQGCTPGCTAAAVSQNNDAITSANLANVGFGVGIVGLGVGTYLVVTSFTKGAPAAARAAASIPQLTVGPHGSSVSWQAEF